METSFQDFHPRKGNVGVYSWITASLTDKSYETLDLIWVKVKELQQAYHKAREQSGCSGVAPHSCCYFKQLDAILGGGPVTSPPHCTPIIVEFGQDSPSISFQESRVADKEEETSQSPSPRVSPRPQMNPGKALQVSSITFPTHAETGNGL